ncbi:MAG: hypothetical protein AAGJ97_12200, partial [Planctomycetota bacterium]
MSNRTFRLQSQLDDQYSGGGRYTQIDERTYDETNGVGTGTESYYEPQSMSEPATWDANYAPSLPSQSTGRLATRVAGSGSGSGLSGSRGSAPMAPFNSFGPGMSGFGSPGGGLPSFGMGGLGLGTGSTLLPRNAVVVDSEGKKLRGIDALPRTQDEKDDLHTAFDAYKQAFPDATDAEAFAAIGLEVIAFNAGEFALITGGLSFAEGVPGLPADPPVDEVEATVDDATDDLGAAPFPVAPDLDDMPPPTDPAPDDVVLADDEYGSVTQTPGGLTYRDKDGVEISENEYRAGFGSLSAADRERLKQLNAYLAKAVEEGRLQEALQSIDQETFDTLVEMGFAHPTSTLRQRGGRGGLGGPTEMQSDRYYIDIPGTDERLIYERTGGNGGRTPRDPSYKFVARVTTDYSPDAIAQGAFGEQDLSNAQAARLLLSLMPISGTASAVIDFADDPTFFNLIDAAASTAGDVLFIGGVAYKVVSKGARSATIVRAIAGAETGVAAVAGVNGVV